MARSQMFLDTRIFIAFLNCRDRHHSQAITLFRVLSAYWHTSALVRSEPERSNRPTVLISGLQCSRSA